jgi:hypothetical protein
MITTDRDLYVTVHPENIQDDYKDNFQTWVDAHTDGVDLGAYDFNSVMHYPLDAFSKNGQATMTLNVMGVTANVGQREKLSVGDLFAIADLYCQDGDLQCAIPIQ